MSRPSSVFDAIIPDHGILQLRCLTEENGRHTYLLDCTPHYSRSDNLEAEIDLEDGFVLPGETCHTGLGWDVRFEPLEGDLARVFVTPAAEIYDSLDNDRDGEVDEGCDDDNDGYCDMSMDRMARPGACYYDPPDCNDNDPQITNADERCDDTDNDCDGEVDEGCDDDEDGYCDSTMTTVGSPSACPHGGGDIIDNDASRYPGAEDRCDGVDNDLDGIRNEDCHCADSDGGADPSVGGTVTLSDSRGVQRSIPDTCDEINPRVVFDQICDSGPDHRRVWCPTSHICIDPDGDGPTPAYCGVP